MKKVFIILSFIFSVQVASAAFVGAKIKVTGVTCSMCSNSVQKALGTLPFISAIEVDLENAVFNVTFRPGQAVSADQIREQVEGAGFSVGQLLMDFQFRDQEVAHDYHFVYAGNTYHFVHVKKQKLDSLVTLRFVDKGMISLKEHKKFAGMTSYDCIRTGRAHDCCGASTQGRVYHVTI
jgi:copper chaperone CopZ